MRHIASHWPVLTVCFFRFAAEKAHLELAEAAKQEIAAMRQKDAEHAQEIERLNSTAASLQESLTAIIAANKDVIGRNEQLISELDQKCANLTAMVTEAQAREQNATAQANESMTQLKQRDEEINNRAKEVRPLLPLPVKLSTLT